jgi:DNA helicase IV
MGARNLTWCEADSDRQRRDLLRQLIADSTAARDQANERFIARELERHARLFDTVESKPLTAAQRRACVVNDDHNLVLAGAGTGKTSVMIGRVGYLLAAELVSPDTVLMVAYNRDAAEELRERAAKRLSALAPADALTIKTFHALGVELIAQAEGVRPSLSVLAEDSHALARFVTETLDELLKDPAYAEKYIEYGWDAQETHRSIFEFQSLEEYERVLARVSCARSGVSRSRASKSCRLRTF